MVLCLRPTRRKLRSWEERAAGDDEEDVKEAEKDLTKTKRLRDDTTEAMGDLEELHEGTKKDWSKPGQRIIGYVIRSPAAAIDTKPYGSIKDYAVAKLDKEKFRKFIKGNVLDLGAF